MIRREEPDATWLIHQAAHAAVAGQIAEHWSGLDALPHCPREELLLAAHFHDAGWVQADQQPRLNAAGQPRNFTEMDLGQHFDIWRASIDAMFAQNRYAGLLTSLHCSALYDMRLRFIDDPPDDRERVRYFLAERRAWERDLVAALRDHPRYGSEVEEKRLATNLRLLQVWDYLSLMLCMSVVHEQELDDVPLDGAQRGALHLAAGGERVMQLNPFPLDAPLTLWLDARPLVGAPFTSQAELSTVLDQAPYKPLVFEIGPFPA